MRWTLLVLAALAVVAAGAAAVLVPGGGAFAQTAPGRRVALVIGNGAYRHAAPLANPPRDARAMAEKLRALGFELVGGRAQLDLDRAALEGAIQQFGRTLR